MEIKNLTEVFGAQISAGLGGAKQMDSCENYTCSGNFGCYDWHSCWMSFTCGAPWFGCLSSFSCGNWMGTGSFSCLSYYCAPPPPPICS